MPNAAEVRVRGFRELNRAFAKADRDLAKNVRKTLKEVAEPVRADAQRRALHEISGLREHSTRGTDWSEMRTGVTTAVVYVAPKQRRRFGSPRPRFGTLLMDLAMQPALDAHTHDVERELDKMLQDLAHDWERGV